MKKVWIRLLTVAVIVAAMLGMAVVVLANSPVIGQQHVVNASIDSTRAVIAAAIAAFCGIMAFAQRHFK